MSEREKETLEKNCWHFHVIISNNCTQFTVQFSVNCMQVLITTKLNVLPQSFTTAAKQSTKCPTFILQFLATKYLTGQKILYLKLIRTESLEDS